MAEQETVEQRAARERAAQQEAEAERRRQAEAAKAESDRARAAKNAVVVVNVTGRRQVLDTAERECVVFEPGVPTEVSAREAGALVKGGRFALAGSGEAKTAMLEAGTLVEEPEDDEE